MRESQPCAEPAQHIAVGCRWACGCRWANERPRQSRRAHTLTRTRAIHTLHAAPTRLYRARRHEKEHVLQLLKVKPAQVKKVKCEDSSCKFSACALLRKRKRSK